MAGFVTRNLKQIAVNIFAVCSFLILIESVSIDWGSDKIPFENDGFESVQSVSSRFISIMLKRSAAQRYSNRSEADRNETLHRIRREIERNKQDEIREEYERRLFESLNIIGSIPATRLYVPENIQDDGTPGSPTKAFNIEIGTVVGKVPKLFPHGKQLIVWPYLGWRNFTVDENTGEVVTTDKMDFELIWLYNMTIRDFRHNYSNPEPLRQPPMPDPRPDDPQQDYVDHYLIVEVIDRNDNLPIFTRDVTGGGRFSGEVNTNARAGTPILYLHPTDNDSGPRGRIRFNIRTENNEQAEFTIDPKTHFLKTTGQGVLKAGQIDLQVEARDYGMPPKKSGFQKFTVRVGKTPPEFLSTPYNLNFSEADVRGSVVGKVQAVSRSGMLINYEILTDDVKNTFAINHLGEITLLRELDYETANDSDKLFTFQVRASEDTFQTRTQDVTVNMRLMNADDHLGMFKTPAKTLAFEEGSSRAGGQIYAVDVEDCDCSGCTCKRGEMIYKIGDTGGFFDITSDGQIQNVDDLDYEKQNYFFFPVTVTDPGKNGRTRTSYVEISVLDIDDTPPIFAQSTYDFAIFEDAPKNQVIGVAQAIDPDPATRPDDIKYTANDPNPRLGSEYFGVENQGVIKVLKNDNQFEDFDKYELTIVAEDQEDNKSKPPATVTIRILDVNDHQPVFTNCKEQSIDEDVPIGTLLTKLSATDEDRGVNKEIEYSLAKVQKHNFFKIDNGTGEVKTTHVLDREQYDEIFVVARATDGGPDRSDPLRQVGYCQFIVKINDVNDHHPVFTVQTFEVQVLRRTAKESVLLQVEALDPDLGKNAKIVYKILSQKKNNKDAEPVDYLKVDSNDGSVKVKSIMTGLDRTDRIYVVIQATNTEKVIGKDIDGKSETTVIVKFSNDAPPTYLKKYVAKVKEDEKSGSIVMTLKAPVTGVVYSLQTIRNRDDVPFFVVSSTGEIKTSEPLDYELEKSYLFAVTAQKNGGLASILIEVNVEDVDDVVPIFGNDRYEATVSEAAKAGDNVFRVQASDPDPINGDPLIYTIEKTNDHETFEVVQKQNFAEIKVAPGIKQGDFDREKREVYTIIIEAHRKSSPTLKSSALLIIDVRDENDSPPEFAQEEYTTEPIPENIPVPYIVPDLVLNATDKDILENAEVYYFITSGNDGRFSMETIYGQDQANTGRLIVSRPLDAKKSPEFEKNPVYTLTVTATDRKHTSTAKITVRVSCFFFTLNTLN